MAEENPWIAHTASECPVNQLCSVQIKFRCWDDSPVYGDMKKNPPMLAGAFNWRQRGTGSDIIAYRIATP